MSTGLDKEAIAHLQDTSTASERDAMITFTDRFGDERQFIYSDAKREYVDADPYVAVTDTVSNIESFADLVVAEAERRGKGGRHVTGTETGIPLPDPEAGECMNVIFTATGATFIPETDDRRDVFKYVRQPSAAFKTLTTGLGSAMPHHAFLIWLETLRDVIPEFSEIMPAFRSLKLEELEDAVRANPEGR